MATGTGSVPPRSLRTASCWRLHHMTTQSGFGVRRRGRYCRRSRATGTRSAPSYSLRTANCWRLHQVTAQWLWNPATGAVLRTLEGHRSPVDAVTFSRDGKLLASASRDHTVRLWDPATGTALQTLEGHGGSVRAVAISQDGKLVASASDYHTVRLWNPATGAALQTIESGATIRRIPFSRDGQYLETDRGLLSLRSPSLTHPLPRCNLLAIYLQKEIG